MLTQSIRVRCSFSNILLIIWLLLHLNASSLTQILYMLRLDNQLVLQRFLIFYFDIQISVPRLSQKVSSDAVIWCSYILYCILQLCLFTIVVSLMVSWIAPIWPSALWCWYKVRRILRIVPSHYSFLTFGIWGSRPSPVNARGAISTRLAALFVVILRRLSHLTLITLFELLQPCRLLCLLIVLIGHAESLIHFCVVSFVDFGIDKFVQVFS